MQEDALEKGASTGLVCLLVISSCDISSICDNVCWSVTNKFNSFIQYSLGVYDIVHLIFIFSQVAVP